MIMNKWVIVDNIKSHSLLLSVRVDGGVCMEGGICTVYIVWVGVCVEGSVWSYVYVWVKMRRQ